MSNNKKPQVQVKIDADQHFALRTLQERDGVPIAEQVRRAIREYLTKKASE